MVAICCMRVIVYPAKAVVEIMSADNGHYCRYQEPKVEGMPHLFCKQEQNADAENHKG